MRRFLGLLLLGTVGCSHASLREPSSVNSPYLNQEPLLIYNNPNEQIISGLQVTESDDTLRLSFTVQRGSETQSETSRLSSTFDGSQFLPPTAETLLPSTNSTSTALRMPLEGSQNAFKLDRLDQGSDLYYLWKDADGRTDLYRSFLGEGGGLAPTEKLVAGGAAGLSELHPLRLADGRILLTFLKSHQLMGLFVDTDLLTESRHPESCLENLVKAGYMATYQCQKQRAAEFKNTPERAIFGQYTATILSLVGKDKEANIIFDQNLTPKPSSLFSFDDLHVEAAVDPILNLTDDKQILIINELTHVPQTKLLIYQLLKPLYQKGFRYLAAESFSEAKISDLNRTGISTLSSGLENSEPSFALLIREAKKQGFKLITYQGNARRLKAQTLKQNPKAKVLVVTDQASLAKELWAQTELESISIDQTTFRERGRLSMEDKNYRRLLEHFKIEEPSILVGRDGHPFVTKEGLSHYDLQVILPPEEILNSRPSWRSEMGDLQNYLISDLICPSGETCLLQAYIRSESSHLLATPFDQVLFDSSGPTSLILSTNRYNLKLIGSDGKQLKTKVITVEN